VAKVPGTFSGGTWRTILSASLDPVSRPPYTKFEQPIGHRKMVNRESRESGIREGAAGGPDGTVSNLEGWRMTMPILVETDARTASAQTKLPPVGPVHFYRLVGLF